MAKEIKGRARPIRVAFLVELEESAQSIVDAVFEKCLGMWGGRYSLIIPVANGRVVPAYFDWLRSFDPDIIYSYVDLERQGQLDIHESIYPAFLTRHRKFPAT